MTRLRRALPVVLIALLALALPTAPATAARHATRAERNDLIHAVHAGIHESANEVGVDLSRVRLSTASSRWAAAQVSLYVEPGRYFAEAFAIFHQRGGEWRLASYTEDQCGPGADLPIPIAAQRDLRLPSCSLGGAELGEEPTVRDSSGARQVRPAALRVSTPDGLARLVDLGPWRTWRVNRAATASTEGTLASLPCRRGCEGDPGEEWDVVLTLRGYRRCGSAVAFRFLEWNPVEGRPRVPHRRFRLGC